MGPAEQWLTPPAVHARVGPGVCTDGSGRPAVEPLDGHSILLQIIVMGMPAR